MAIARTLLKNPPILLLDEATRYIILDPLSLLLKRPSKCVGYIDREGHPESSPKSCSRAFLAINRSPPLGKAYGDAML